MKVKDSEIKTQFNERYRMKKKKESIKKPEIKKSEKWVSLKEAKKRLEEYEKEAKKRLEEK